MKWFLNRSVPCSLIFQIATSFEDFEKWLLKEHNRSVDDEILPGYKYFLYCNFSSIFDAIAGDDIGIKSDLLLERANTEGHYILTLPNSSERIILLKNIHEI